MLLIIIMASLSRLTFAYELAPIVHTSKQSFKSDQVIESSDVITEEEITQNLDYRLTDVLSGSAGFDINQRGVVGGEASSFLRGAEARHTVILIDGMKVNDPTSVDRSFNLSLLSADQIESIEIIKGGGGVLYGSDAIAGVVNIITKKKGKKNKLKLAAGSQNRLSLEQNIKLGNTHIILSPYYYESNQFSDVDSNNEIEERDLKINRGLHTSVFYEKDNFKSHSLVKIFEDYGEVDGQDFTTDLPVENDNAYVKNRFFLINENLTLTLAPTKTLNTSFGFKRSERLNRSDFGQFYFDSYSSNAEVRLNIKKTNGENIFGTNFEEEVYRDDEISSSSKQLYEAFTTLHRKYGKNQLRTGARISHRNNFGSNFIYDLGLRRNLTYKQEVHLNFSTGFRSPSLYQLYGKFNNSPIGNADLAPEKSANLEMGHTFKQGSFGWETNFFRNRVRDYINFQDNSYVNVGGADIDGIENTFKFIKAKYELSSNITLMQIKLTDGTQVERRPTELFNFDSKFFITDKLFFGADLQYKGKAYEDINGTEEILGPYSLVNIYLNLDRDTYKNYFSIKNIFNTSYEVAKGYRTQGASFEAGLDFYY